MTPAQAFGLTHGFAEAADQFVARAGARGSSLWLTPAALAPASALHCLISRADRVAIIGQNQADAEEALLTVVTAGAHVVSDPRAAMLLLARSKALASHDPVQGFGTSVPTMAARQLLAELNSTMRAAGHCAASSMTRAALADIWGVCSEAALRKPTRLPLSPDLGAAVTFGLARIAQLELAQSTVNAGPTAVAWIRKALGGWLAQFEDRPHTLTRAQIDAVQALARFAGSLPAASEVPALHPWSINAGSHQTTTQPHEHRSAQRGGPNAAHPLPVG